MIRLYFPVKSLLGNMLFLGFCSIFFFCSFSKSKHGIPKPKAPAGAMSTWGPRPDPRRVCLAHPRLGEATDPSNESARNDGDRDSDHPQ